MAKVLPSYLHFFWAGVAKVTQTGGIVPSQRFLVGKMISPVPADYRGQILELGPGSGALTLRLAARCPGARILACEINPTLAQLCRSNVAEAGLSDRVEVVSDGAESVLSALRKKGAPKADFIISGIPLGSLRRKQVESLVGAIAQSVSDTGMYIQFQHSLIDRKNIQAQFSKVHTVPVFLNFPPAVVYYARR
jgi:phospholipid N-methyltransferase